MGIQIELIIGCGHRLNTIHDCQASCNTCYVDHPLIGQDRKQLRRGRGTYIVSTRACIVTCYIGENIKGTNSFSASLPLYVHTRHGRVCNQISETFDHHHGGIVNNQNSKGSDC
jgi:hypothetical protein